MPTNYTRMFEDAERELQSTRRILQQLQDDGLIVKDPNTGKYYSTAAGRKAAGFSSKEN